MLLTLPGTAPMPKNHQSKMRAELQVREPECSGAPHHSMAHLFYQLHRGDRSGRARCGKGFGGPAEADMLQKVGMVYQ